MEIRYICWAFFPPLEHWPLTSIISWRIYIHISGAQCLKHRFPEEGWLDWIITSKHVELELLLDDVRLFSLPPLSLFGTKSATVTQIHLYSWPSSLWSSSSLLVSWQSVHVGVDSSWNLVCILEGGIERRACPVSQHTLAVAVSYSLQPSSTNFCVTTWSHIKILL